MAHEENPHSFPRRKGQQNLLKGERITNAKTRIPNQRSERDIKENKKFAGGSQRGNIGVDQQRKLRKIMVPEGVDFICIHETKAEEIKKNVCCAI